MNIYEANSNEELRAAVVELCIQTAAKYTNHVYDRIDVAAERIVPPVPTPETEATMVCDCDPFYRTHHQDCPVLTCITTLIQRSEAAEAELAKFRAVGAMELREQRDRAEADRDALRKDAAMLDRVQDNLDIMNRSGELSDAAFDKFYEVIPHERYMQWLTPKLDAALAVQP